MKIWIQIVAATFILSPLFIFPRFQKKSLERRIIGTWELHEFIDFTGGTARPSKGPGRKVPYSDPERYSFDGSNMTWLVYSSSNSSEVWVNTSMHYFVMGEYLYTDPAYPDFKISLTEQGEELSLEAKGMCTKRLHRIQNVLQTHDNGSP